MTALGGPRGRAARRWLAALRALAPAALAPAAGAAAQADVAVERDTASLLAPARLAALPAAERARWAAYVARSRADHARDSAAVAGELARLGRERPTPARVVPDFRLRPTMTDAWFRTDSARALGVAMMSYQAPNGGWSKHLDYSAPRRAGGALASEGDGFAWVATLDNGATTTQLHFLARLHAAQPDARWAAALERGVRYLLRAQYPTGSWPQVYPLRGGYHDAETYNDDATVNALEMLRLVAGGRWAWAPAALRRAAAAAVRRGVDGILADQVALGARLTVWGQQHDPLTHRPVRARSYELAGLTGGESAGVLDFLMSLPAPDARVRTAVHAGAAWLRAHAVPGVRYDSLSGTFVHDSAAAPTWARVYELPSLRPVMANRDGVPRYDFAELTDRRTGYGWFRRDAAETLRRYDAWARRYPAPVTRTGPAAR